MLGSMNDKRTQLVEASIDLFAEEGFWNTPTTRIVKHAGVGTGTLFNYFGSKEGLIEEVYLQLKKEWADYIVSGWPEQATVRDQVRHLWYRYIDWGMQYPERYALKQQLRLSELVNDDMHDQQEDSLAFAVDLFNRAVSSGVLRDIPLDYFALLMVAQVEAAVEYAQTRGLQGEALRRHMDLSFELFWNAVKV
jgi:AcrR family transcriptional regulator